MKRFCQLGLFLVVLMTFVGCGGGGSTSQSMGPNDDFAALLNEVAGPQAMHVQNVVAVGGGSVEALFNPNSPILAKANFSFFASYDKNGEPKGNFVLKRVFTGDGVRGVKSTEIMYVDVGEDSIGRYVIMEGIADWEATWTNARPPDHTFRLQAWDIEDGIDMIWFEVRRPNESLRPAATLVDNSELRNGNIMVRLIE